MTRKAILAALIVLVLAPVAAWAQQKVSVDFDQTYDFTKIKTFSVQVATAWGNPLGEKRVLDEVGQSITAKGWTMADPDAADATVLLHGTTEQKKQLDAFYTGGPGWRYGGMGSATVTETVYTVGTLVVDIFDTKTKALLFRGTATDELASTVDRNKKKLEKATTKMFANFPPVPAPVKKK